MQRGYGSSQGGYEADKKAKANTSGYPAGGYYYSSQVNPYSNPNSYNSSHPYNNSQPNNSQHVVKSNAHTGPGFFQQKYHCDSVEPEYVNCCTIL